MATREGAEIVDNLHSRLVSSMFIHAQVERRQLAIFGNKRTCNAVVFRFIEDLDQVVEADEKGERVALSLSQQHRKGQHVADSLVRFKGVLQSPQFLVLFFGV